MNLLKTKKANKLFVEDEVGKGLSTNDYTNTDKQLVQGAVQKTGDQTIGGVKTFTSAPVVPDATLPQHPVTLNQGVLKTQIKQTTGTSESDLMSQKAVTDAIDETKMVTDTRVSSLENTLTDSAESVVELDTRMTTAESEIDTLQSTVAGIETLLAAI